MIEDGSDSGDGDDKREYGVEEEVERCGGGDGVDKERVDGGREAVEAHRKR